MDPIRFELRSRGYTGNCPERIGRGLCCTACEKGCRPPNPEKYRRPVAILKQARRNVAGSGYRRTRRVPFELGLPTSSGETNCRDVFPAESLRMERSWLRRHAN